MEMLFSIYLIGFVVISLISLFSAARDDDFSAPLAFAAHLFWPVTVPIVFLWAKLDAYRARQF